MEDIRKGEIKRNILLITEANEKVASGHFMECLELADLLENEGVGVSILYNADAPDGLKEKCRNIGLEYKNSIYAGADRILDLVSQFHYDAIVTDLREIENKWIKEIKDKYINPLVCIDEFGNRELDADVIINPMIDTSFWDYKMSKGTVYAGHEFLILPRKIIEYHERDKLINEQVNTATVSMGGVDYYDTAYKLLSWMPKKYNKIIWNFVLGAGYQHFDTFEQLAVHFENVRIFRNIDFIYELFWESDIAVCAGGNTLHELACIGTPALIIPTMVHEGNNGRAFESKGFGICLDRTEFIKKENIIKSFDRLLDYDRRERMSGHGRLLCMGDGGKRVVEILKNICPRKLFI